MSKGVLPLIILQIFLPCGANLCQNKDFIFQLLLDKTYQFAFMACFHKTSSNKEYHKASRTSYLSVRVILFVINETHLSLTLRVRKQRVGCDNKFKINNYHDRNFDSIKEYMFRFLEKEITEIFVILKTT